MVDFRNRNDMSGMIQQAYAARASVPNQGLSMVNSGLQGLQQGLQLAEAIGGVMEKKKKQKKMEEMIKSPEFQELFGSQQIVGGQNVGMPMPQNNMNYGGLSQALSVQPQVPQLTKQIPGAFSPGQRPLVEQVAREGGSSKILDLMAEKEKFANKPNTYQNSLQLENIKQKNRLELVDRKFNNIKEAYGDMNLNQISQQREDATKALNYFINTYGGEENIPDDLKEEYLRSQSEKFAWDKMFMEKKNKVNQKQNTSVSKPVVQKPKPIFTITPVK